MIGETNKKEQQGFVKSLKVPVTEAKIGLFQVAMEMLVLLAIVQFLIILFATTRLTNSLNLAKREITELEEKLKDSQLVQIKEQVNNLLDNGGIILGCGTCLQSRNNKEPKVCKFSSMKDLYDLIRKNKVL